MKKKATKKKLTAKHATKPISRFKAAIAARDFKAELRRIVDFLNVGDHQSNDLWSVLSALRGPDVYRSDLIEKRSTTCVIRKAIGLLPYRVPASVMPDAEQGRQRRVASIGGIKQQYIPTMFPITSEHFDDHARYAFEALGLKWEELNEPEVKI